MNCFVAYVNTEDGKPHLLLEGLNGDSIRCRRWDGQRFSIEAEERICDLVPMQLQIIHYYGLSKIEFKGAWEFLWHHYTALIYLRIAVGQKWQSVCQFLFNQRSLASQERIRILRLMVAKRLSGSGEGLSAWDVMTELYSFRWIEHPDGESRAGGVEFQLESLVESGDLAKSGITYLAKPKSMVTLAQIDDQDRRHREASRLQLWLVILTFILAVASIVQTGLIQLPLVFDFRGK
ncbi:MAG: hypothetical protein KF751_06210 [Nitrospira sp.]|nr:hypothetical protein [Nitrospira sp.]